MLAGAQADRPWPVPAGECWVWRLWLTGHYSSGRLFHSRREVSGLGRLSSPSLREGREERAGREIPELELSPPRPLPRPTLPEGG